MSHIALFRCLVLQKMRSTYVGQAARLETTRIVPLKTGKLSTKMIADISKAGIVHREKKIFLHGVECRARRRMLDFDGREVPINYRLPLGEDRWLCIGDKGHLFQQKMTKASGFWPYITADGRIHPNFNLHRVVTGRTSSDSPSGQNLPKHGKLAKEYRKIFVPRPGYVFLEPDLSQAELRIAAWMSGDPTMMRIYRAGGDIHAYTAAAILKIDQREFARMKNSKRPVPASMHTHLFQGETYGEYYDFMRFCAKAVNNHFIRWQQTTPYAIPHAMFHSLRAAPHVPFPSLLFSPIFDR